MVEQDGLRSIDAPSRRGPNVPTPRAQVLIIDDHDASRRVCADYCDLFDHASTAVRSQAEAVAALSCKRFDVVLLNVHMDGVGGLEIVRAIRALPSPAATLPIIGLTPPGRDDGAQRWVAAGLSGVVAKPVTAARLFAAIKSALTPDQPSARSWAPAEATQARAQHSTLTR
jgi:CheY-like chemotaxis protein